MKTHTSCVFFILCIFLHGYSGNNDTVVKHHHRNVISLNPTPAIIFSNVKNITLRYERLVRDNQSTVVQVGWLELDPFFSDTLGGFFNIVRKSNSGLNLAFDYRFYMLKRNKFCAPDGLYIGPYVSYYGFKFVDQFSYYRGDTVRMTGEMAGAYNFINVGAEIGYQLILWNRLSIDFLIFGPSLTYAFSKWTVSDFMTDEEKNDLAERVKEKLNEKYPILVPFFHPSTESNYTSVRWLLRYSISIGFHF